MFHWQDNVFFGRTKDGSVRVLIFKQVKAGFWPKADEDYSELEHEFDMTIPDNHWGSIVASVSHGGEENGRWYQAMEFHNGKAP